MAGNKKTCTCCGKSKASNIGFYLSHSNLYRSNDGRMAICKDCLFERYKELLLKYEDDEIKAIYHLCMNLDVYFNKELVESSFKQEGRSNKPESLLKVYLTKVNSLMQYKGMNSIGSDVVILNEDVIKEIEEKYKKEYKDIVSLNKKKLKKEKSINDDIRRKWGREYTDEECLQLEDYYDDYFENYNHNGDYAKLDILKEICTFKLIISQAKRDRDNKTIKDFSDLISKKMADANLKPSQQKVLGEGSEDTFGVRLRIYETEKPVPEVQESLKDVDKFWQYIMKYLVKPFAMAMDLAKGTYSIDEGDKIELNKELSEHVSEEVSSDE